MFNTPIVHRVQSRDSTDQIVNCTQYKNYACAER